MFSSWKKFKVFGGGKAPQAVNFWCFEGKRQIFGVLEKFELFWSKIYEVGGFGGQKLRSSRFLDAFLMKLEVFCGSTICTILTILTILLVSSMILWHWPRSSRFSFGERSERL